MGKRGPKPGFNPKKRISEEWRPELAYAIGLIASDGCLSPPGHLIDFTSKDSEQLENFIRCLGVPLKITYKKSGNNIRCGRVQFKSVLFYAFLESIGLTPAKSRTLGALVIPPRLFWDFLRGVFDGDGSTYSYWDPRWKSSFMYYVCFASASKAFIKWLQENIERRIGVRGHVTFAHKKDSGYFQLKYAKADGLKVLRGMYTTSKSPIFLGRKRLKIDTMLGIVGVKL